MLCAWWQVEHPFSRATRLETGERPNHISDPNYFLPLEGNNGLRSKSALYPRRAPLGSILPTKEEGTFLEMLFSSPGPWAVGAGRCGKPHVPFGDKAVSEQLTFQANLSRSEFA